MQSSNSEKWKFTITNHLKTLTTAIRYEKLKQNMEFFENQIFLISQQFLQIKIQKIFIQSIYCIHDINPTKDFGKILNFWPKLQSSRFPKKLRRKNEVRVLKSSFSTHI